MTAPCVLSTPVVLLKLLLWAALFLLRVSAGSEVVVFWALGRVTAPAHVRPAQRVAGRIDGYSSHGCHRAQSTASRTKPLVFPFLGTYTKYALTFISLLLYSHFLK